MGTEVKQQSTMQTKTPMKVLVADDDAPTRILLRAAITQWGYQVVEAHDGEEAWKLLQEPDTPKLMIVDWLMPKLDGIDLCKRIKAEMDHYPYIILLTQLSGTTNIVKGLEAGADEFLSKPFNMAELQSRLAVGTRIINYKNELARQNMELKLYFIRTKELTEIVTDATKKIDVLIEQCVQMGESGASKQQMEKLRELHNDFKHIMDVIHEISSEHEEQGDES